MKLSPDDDFGRPSMENFAPYESLDWKWLGFEVKHVFLTKKWQFCLQNAYEGKNELELKQKKGPPSVGGVDFDDLGRVLLCFFGGKKTVSHQFG